MPPHALAWGHLHEGNSLGDSGKLFGGTWSLSWRSRFVKGRKGKKRENCKGRKGGTTKKQKSETPVKVSRTSTARRPASEGLHSWCGQIWRTVHRETVGSMCWAREGLKGPPYHHTGELPLLTRFPSLPGGTFGAADNTNQSESDYSPQTSQSGALFMTLERPSGGNGQKSQSPHPNFYPTDSETRNTFYWPHTWLIMTSWNSLIEFSSFSLINGKCSHNSPSKMQ